MDARSRQSITLAILAAILLALSAGCAGKIRTPVYFLDSRGEKCEGVRQQTGERRACKEMDGYFLIPPEGMEEIQAKVNSGFCL